MGLEEALLSSNVTFVVVAFCFGEDEGVFGEIGVAAVGYCRCIDSAVLIDKGKKSGLSEGCRICNDAILASVATGGITADRVCAYQFALSWDRRRTSEQACAGGRLQCVYPTPQMRGTCQELSPSRPVA